MVKKMSKIVREKKVQESQNGWKWLKSVCLFGLLYFGPIYLDPSIWTCLFGPVFLDPFFGPIYLEMSIWTYDIWHVTSDMSHVTHDMWHVTQGGGWPFSHNFSSPSFMVWDKQCLKGSELKDYLINQWNEWQTCL